MPRPPVSVIVPFLGDAGEARRLMTELRRVALAPGDEILIADNTDEGVVHAEGQSVRVVRADAERSPFHARNEGADAARNPWLLFLDADCRPCPDILARYFHEPVGERCGIMAGAVRPRPDQPGVIPAYARSRRQLSEEYHVEARQGWPYPAGITGNLLVKRDAFEAVGGFQEGLRAGADIELCWRVQDAGWTFRHVPAAWAEHAHVASLGLLARQARTHGAGMQWLNRRYPGSFPPPQLGRQLARCAGGAAAWLLTLRPRRALFKLIDAAWFLAYAHGYWIASNRAWRRSAREPATAIVVTEDFPRHGQTGVPRRAHVESLRRPERLGRHMLARASVAYAEDDPPAQRLWDASWLVVRHPLRVARARGVQPRGPRLTALAPVARRCSRSLGEGLPIVWAEGSPASRRTFARLRALVGPQSASTRWRREPRAEA